MNLADELRGLVPKVRKLPAKRVFVEAEDAKRERERQLSRLRAKKSRERNLEKARAIQAIYRERNKEKIAKLKEEWRKKNIARIRKQNAKRMREWRQAHPELAKAKAKAWAAANQEHINAKRRERYAKAKSLRLQAQGSQDQGKAGAVRRSRAKKFSGAAGRQGVQHGEAAFQGSCG